MPTSDDFSQSNIDVREQKKEKLASDQFFRDFDGFDVLLDIFADSLGFAMPVNCILMSLTHI
jgi:hypothetical protein